MKPTRHFPSIERLEDRIAPATFMVTNLLDDASPGTLRKALIDANALEGLDTIVFQKGLTGTISNDGDAFLIDDPLIIKGPGMDLLTLSGGGLGRVLQISGNNAATISGLTIAQGSSLFDGAGIYSTAPVTLSKVRITNNHHALGGGGPVGAGLWIHTTGDIVLKDCEISNNGGAITFFSGGADLATTGGKIVISGTKVMNNSASRAGGINVALGDATTSLTVDRSTFADNTGQADIGGGLRITSLGGAVTVKSSLFTSNESGVLANTEGGGAISQTGGSLTVLGSTFTKNESGNGGAIAFSAGSQATIQKSHFELNRAGSAEGGGAVELNGVNIWKVTGSKFIGNGTTGNGGALDVMGGTGEISGSTFRGNSATLEGGAVFLSPTVAGTVTVKSSLFTANRAGNDGGAMSIGGNLTVLGSRFLTNESANDGGAIWAANGEILISGSLFEGNVATFGGGGIRSGSYPTHLTVLGSTFARNHALGAGAIDIDHAVGDSFEMRGCKVLGNSASGSSGGIYVFSKGTVVIDKTRIADNRATTDGGGLFLQLENGGTGTVSNSTITGNTAGFASVGGGIRIFLGSVVALTKNKITDNFAGTGGGVFNSGTVIPTGNKITGNFAVIDPDTSGF